MIEGVFALAGVVVGAILPWLGNHLTERWRRQRAAKYLAVRVVCILDRCQDACISVTRDNGYHHGERDEFLQIQIPSPAAPSYPDEIEWTAIEPDLMYRILSLPAKAALAEQDIGKVFEFGDGPPDYEDGFVARQSGYKKLARETREIADCLRKCYSIKERAYVSVCSLDSAPT